MATAGVSLLERQRRYAAATDRLHQLLGGRCCPGRRGEWWQRLATDLEHLNKCGFATWGMALWRRRAWSGQGKALCHCRCACCLPAAPQCPACDPSRTRPPTRRPAQALELVEAALADDSLSSGDRLGLQRRWLRLGA